MPEIGALGNGAISLTLEEFEAEILRRLAVEMRLLLEADVPDSDPVVQRLFPRAYDAADDEAAFRQMIGDDLREIKSRTLDEVAAALGTEGGCEVILARDEVDGWLTLLTDLRLSIGARLDVDEQRMAAEVDPGDPDAVALSILHWLGYLQGILVEHALEDR